MPCAQTRRPDVNSILKLIYRFNVIPNKLPRKIFVQTEKCIPKLAEDVTEKCEGEGLALARWLRGSGLERCLHTPSCRSHPRSVHTQEATNGCVNK